MDALDERKLKEPFVLQKDQCVLLLQGVDKMIKSFKYYYDDLECDVWNPQLKRRIETLVAKVVEKEVNLSNTLSCIQSSLGEMKEEFDNFEVDEEQEIYFPNYEIHLRDQIKEMNKSDISKREIDHHAARSAIWEVMKSLSTTPHANAQDEDFEEIESETHLDKIPIDPFTQKEVEIPVRNRYCRHVYDKDGITNYINQRQMQRKAGKCPTIGCSSRLTFNDLIEDHELREKINRLKLNR